MKKTNYLFFLVLFITLLVSSCEKQTFSNRYYEPIQDWGASPNVIKKKMSKSMKGSTLDAEEKRMLRYRNYGASGFCLYYFCDSNKDGIEELEFAYTSVFIGDSDAEGNQGKAFIELNEYCDKHFTFIEENDDEIIYKNKISEIVLDKGSGLVMYYPLERICY